MVEVGGERCCSRKESSSQDLTSEQSWILFAFAVRWGAKVRSPHYKKFKMPSWKNFGHKMDSTFWQTNKVLCKPFSVSVAKPLISLDASKTLADIENISKTFWTQSFEHPIWYRRVAFGSRKYHYCERSLDSYQSTEDAAGFDEIRPEMFKILNREGVFWLIHVCQLAWCSGRAPKGWKTGVIIPIHKKAGSRECNNRRGISLLNLFAKVHAKCLEERCREIL